KRWHEYHRQHEHDEDLKPHDDVVSKVRLTLMSMNELLKIVRYSNLFDLNILIDAIDSINDETKTAVNNSDDVSNSSGSNK
ncbi:unnamed protein product, partial [Rotaria magnacalcarata]